MKFSDLKQETQLHIITELSKLETSTNHHPITPINHNSEKVNISDAQRERLEEYGLSVKCLTHPSDNLHLSFTFDGDVPKYPRVINQPSNSTTYLNFNKLNLSQANQNKVGISMNFGGTTYVDGLAQDAPIESTMSGRVIFSDEQTIRDTLENAWLYLNSQNALDKVSNVIAKLIQAYDVAMTLPEDLIGFINDWVPSKAVISFIGLKIQHDARQYRDTDEEEPTITGYDSYIIRNVYHKCGLEVMHATNSRYYNNYHVNINYVQKDDAPEGVLTATVTFNGTDEILLKQVDVLPDLTVSEMVDLLADMVESIKEVSEWGDKLADLIDHLHENIIEVKPFVLNTLAG